VKGSGRFFQIVPVIPVQDLPDPDRKGNFRVIGGEKGLFFFPKPHTPDALCYENMIFRTGSKAGIIERGDFL
jgi:hypothetical protein